MHSTKLDFPQVTLRDGEDRELARAIEAGIYAEHLLDKDPFDDELSAVAEAGREARTRLWWAGLRVGAWHAFREVREHHTPFEDVLQDACVAVAEAVCTWDYTRGVAFTTYAYQRVEIALHDAGRHRAGHWTGSRGDRRAARLATIERHRLAGLGIELDTGEVAARIGVSPTAAIRGATVIVGLPEDPIPDDAASRAFEEVEFADVGFLDLLSERHRRLLRLRFGLDGREYTLQEAAQELEISVTTAARHLQHALEKARGILESDAT